MRRTKIEWTESTWNPVTGCTKISEGCQNCYAERMTKRLQAMGQPNYTNGFRVTCHPESLQLPLKWKRPQMVFVNSMSDLFHEAVSTDFIEEIFGVMNRAQWHCFQILTKRHERLAELAPRLTWSANIWMGVTVENEGNVKRIDALRTVPAAVRFLSLEPLLGRLSNLGLKAIHWVIVGGESGPGARPMKSDWAVGIRDQCVKADVPFFFKQWGGIRKSAAGRELNGRTWDQMPVASICDEIIVASE